MPLHSPLAAPRGGAGRALNPSSPRDRRQSGCRVGMREVWGLRRALAGPALCCLAKNSPRGRAKPRRSPHFIAL